MGNSVVLDPYDVWRLTRGLGVTFSEMIGKQLMLSVVDGLILPSLNMENQTGACPFLNTEGRCSIHAFRPGICRLFPLGRYYHDGGFSYVLMTGECQKENRSKIKIDKWLGEPNLKAYEKFILQWKSITEQTRELLIKTTDLEQQKQISVSLLQKYFVTPYGEDFFADFSTKL
jgi:Fe-S-cluster containining protein